MDMIDLMPPGLYEAVITGVDDGIEHPRTRDRRIPVRAWKRATLDDIRALGGNTPDDDVCFATAARLSEVTQGLYRTFASPAVRAASTEQSAEALRRSHPNRLRFEMFADANPAMAAVAACAEWARANRHPVSADNPFLALERLLSDAIGNGLEAWSKARDAWAEEIFFGTYGSAWLQAVLGLRADGGVATRAVERDLGREAMKNQMAAHLREQVTAGGLAEAAVRALLYVQRQEGKADERGFAVLQQISSELPAAKRLGLARFKEMVKEQFLILRMDEEAAIAALPKLLPEDRRTCEAALKLIHRVAEARGPLSEERHRRLARVETLFGRPAAAKAAMPQPEMTAS